MTRVEIVSASAGTGKTYRLAQIVEDAVCRGQVRPSAIVAVTFTKKAAAELSHRLRARILEAGRVQEARELVFARIGTVNAVCAGLVSEFALELGVSPEIKILDEERAAVLFSEVLSQIVQSDDAAVLEDLRHRLVEHEWATTVREIVTLARANGLEPGDLATSKTRSLDSLRAALPVVGVNEALEDMLSVALDHFLSAVSALGDETATTARAVEVVRQAGRLLVAKRSLPWSLWNRLAVLDAGAAMVDHVAEVRAVAGQLLRHPQFARDLESVTTRCFDLARRGLEAFESEKRRRGLIDFIDQERLALALLRMPEARSRLSGEIDLLLVDEFQDTSPLQLAVFASLSELATQSVWVGDQKQAIYGFRGTDPRLMDAAISSVLGDREPEVLGQSWRSRPALVRLTSSLFAPPFEAQGIPRARVELVPAVEGEPPDLGPIVERWRLNSTTKIDDAGALAAAIAKLIAAKVRVRDRHGGTKEVTAGDIAVLCRTNESCRRVASAITEQAIPTTVARPGLLSTPEALLIRAGLRLWAQPKDALAAAEIGRFVEKEDKWVEEAFATEQLPFDTLPEVLALRAARQKTPWAGPVCAFDAIVRVLDVKRRCLGWGDSERRLQNVEALRALVVFYAEERSGAGLSIAGLEEHLSEVARELTDEFPSDDSINAVRVVTWHSSKGLEWPIVVLYDLDVNYRGTPLGVQAVAPATTFSLESPLSGRWIRFWPNPFLSTQVRGPFFDALSQCSEARDAEAEQRRQELRLLYVGWTRARDRLVLAAKSDRLTDGILSLLQHRGIPLVREPMARTIWAQQRVDIVVREGATRPPIEGQHTAGTRFPVFSRERAIATRMSKPTEVGSVRARFEIGRGIPLATTPANADDLGNALHAFFAADVPDLDRGIRIQICTGLLAAHDLTRSVDAQDVLTASDALRRWISERWPAASWYREFPLSVRRGDGGTQTGIADLALHDESGWIVIDHKSFAQDRDIAVTRAAEYYGQVRAYGEVLTKATARPVVGTFIHLPVAGLIVEFAPDELSKQGRVA